MEIIIIIIHFIFQTIIIGCDARYLQSPVLLNLYPGLAFQKLPAGKSLNPLICRGFGGKESISKKGYLKNLQVGPGKISEALEKNTLNLEPGTLNYLLSSA